MARKKKKKVKNNKQRAQRQQKKQRRRSARTVERAPVRSRGEMDQNPYFEDMRPLFPRAGEQLEAQSQMALMEPIFYAAWETHDLIDEPEFDDIGFNPLEFPKLLEDASQSLGQNFEEVGDLAQDERRGHFLELLDLVVDDLVTDEVRDEIIDALEKMRARFRNTRQRRKDLPRVAAAQMMIESYKRDDEEDDDESVLSTIGVIQALFTRSFELSLTLMDVAAEMEEFAESEGLEGEAVQKLLDSSDPQGDSKLDRFVNKLVARVQNIPNINRHVEDSMDEQWDKGCDALFAGRLLLNLYSKDEIATAAGMFLQARFEIVKGFGFQIGIDDFSDMSDAEIDRYTEYIEELDTPPDLGETVNLLLPRYMDFVEELFDSEERIAKLRTHLNSQADKHLKDGTEWAVFVLELREYLEEDPEGVLDGQVPMRALLGEVRMFMLSETDTEDEEGNKEDDLDEGVEAAERV